MKKHVGRGRCARCWRGASVEVVYRNPSEGGTSETRAGRFCDRHRPAGVEGLTMQVRQLETRGRGRAVGSKDRRPRVALPGHRSPWTPLSLLSEREGSPEVGRNGEP